MVEDVQPSTMVFVIMQWIPLDPFCFSCTNDFESRADPAKHLSPFGGYWGRTYLTVDVASGADFGARIAATQMHDRNVIRISPLPSFHSI